MAEMKQAFVTGFPIKHSRSPLIHNYWLQRYGLSGSYKAIENSPENFPHFANTLAEQGLRGGNVTIPHKETAFALCEKRDAAAEAIGAVNTLWIDAENKLNGGNTDAYGFVANLDAQLPDWDKGGKTALVLGAGGASRAVLYALLNRGFEKIIVVNRTVERAQALADHFGSKIEATGWDQAQGFVSSADVIVNTTSLGMSGHGEAEAFPLDFSAAKAGAVATDIVYIPLETPFLAQARQAGLRCVDGLGMLLHQAVPGFEHWFGLRPEVTDELRQIILNDVQKS
ncbi:shikimate dehydrogenase [Ochrobactrum sp. MR34]|nr:shikimate dehydrogenase [Ochrobactrum sp. MR34]